jgi:hypothetical protein
MSSHHKGSILENVEKKSITKQLPETARVALPSLEIWRSSGDQKLLSHKNMMQLQRTIGNRRVRRLLGNTPPTQPKLTAGPVGDKYAQETDQVAKKVVEHFNSPSPQPAQRQKPEEKELLQGQFETAQQQAAEDEELLQGRFAGSEPPTQRQDVEDAVENRTGMPDPLKAGLEQLSGIDLAGVRVHRNSAKPAQLNALAYTQGQHIHVGPGQERHIPHEGWHAVQQAQGRVTPTMHMKEGVPVNDDKGLEHEADVMGAKALQMRRSEKSAFEFSIHQRATRLGHRSRTTGNRSGLSRRAPYIQRLWDGHALANAPTPISIDALFSEILGLPGLDLARSLEIRRDPPVEAVDGAWGPPNGQMSAITYRRRYWIATKGDIKKQRIDKALSIGSDVVGLAGNIAGAMIGGTGALVDLGGAISDIEGTDINKGNAGGSGLLMGISEGINKLAGKGRHGLREARLKAGRHLLPIDNMVTVVLEQAQRELREQDVEWPFPWSPALTPAQVIEHVSPESLADVLAGYVPHDQQSKAIAFYKTEAKQRAKRLSGRRLALEQARLSGKRFLDVTVHVWRRRDTFAPAAGAQDRLYHVIGFETREIGKVADTAAGTAFLPGKAKRDLQGAVFLNRFASVHVVIGHLPTAPAMPGEVGGANWPITR